MHARHTHARQCALTRGALGAKFSHSLSVTPILSFLGLGWSLCLRISSGSELAILGYYFDEHVVRWILLNCI
jgi:hypothetical protein